MRVNHSAMPYALILHSRSTFCLATESSSGVAGWAVSAPSQLDGGEIRHTQGEQETAGVSDRKQSVG
eukprot:362747-Pleurochrysis_carterae.AAC.2